MRILLGVILGILLTVGVAYVADAGHTATCPAAEGRPLVNWDEVALRYKTISTTVQTGWHRLTGR